MKSDIGYLKEQFCRSHLKDNSRWYRDKNVILLWQWLRYM